jgi:hypothetical protein
MANGKAFSNIPYEGAATGKSGVNGERAEFSDHPAWHAFVRYCHELKHGEIDCLKIQDGLPILAEVTRRKVKFT